MQYIKFNDYSTADDGLLIEKMPAAARAARRFNTSEPFGYNGALLVDEGAYGNVDTQAVINCSGKVSPDELFAIFSGEGWLTTSDRPDKKRWVYLYGKQSAGRLRTPSKTYDSVTIPITADPFCYELTPEVIEASNGMNIPGRGEYAARPLIKITGTDAVALMVGSCSMVISGLKAAEPLFIDALTKYAYVLKNGEMTAAYAAGVTINMMVTSTPDRWPQLKHDGATPVSWTGSAAVEITPNWRWF